MTDPLRQVFDGLGATLRGPAFRLVADGRTLSADAMERSGPAEWRDGAVVVRLSAEVAADGSRALTLRAEGVHRVSEVCLLDHEVTPAPAEIHTHRWWDDGGWQRCTAVLLRGGADGGVFACYANPFGESRVDGHRVCLFYRPGVDCEDGVFVSDPLVLGRFTREGREVARRLLWGRDLVGGREAASHLRMWGPTPAVLDAGEARAVRSAVAQRVPWQPARMRVAHWDWGENLYRRTPADPQTMEVFARLTRLCKELGVEVLLLDPGSRNQAGNHGEQPEHGGGPWQQVMWLAEGVRTGRGEWRAGEHAPGVDALLALCRDAGLEVVAYTNPQYLWDRRDEWRVVLESEPPGLEWTGGYRWACLGVPAVRDHITRLCREFAEVHALRGFSLDFVFWQPCHAEHHGHEPGEASLYAQWDGYRRLLAAIVEAVPDAWVEGLIGSQVTMPWGARGMVHPHPMLADNQPQWMPAWPDLSLDRVNANQQRRIAHWLRNLGCTPSYKVPGQVGHQANRMREPAVERGWDWEGARYNLLSAIASAPSTLQLCYLPCWDEDEWRGMRERDGAFFARWIGFAREHAQVLSRLEDLYDDPRPGSVDGTAARGDDGRGFVFLCNPDHVEHTVRVPLDGGVLLRELHPEAGRTWSAEQVVVEPHEVAVLGIVPAAEVATPVVLGASAVADSAGSITAARGIAGTSRAVEVRHADGAVSRSVLHFASDGVTPALGPWRVDGLCMACDWTPGRALPGLLASLAPPVPPQGDERLQPWSDPSRLRLFLDLLDPESVTVQARVDGENVAVLQTWVGTWPDVVDEQVHNNLMGHHLDLHDRLLAAAAAGGLDRPWHVELRFSALRDGQLRGVHVAHLPRRTTTGFRVDPQ